MARTREMASEHDLTRVADLPDGGGARLLLELPAA
jgi:hypothetical protein